MSVVRTRLGGHQVDTIQDHPNFDDVAFKTVLECVTTSITEDTTIPTNRNCMSIGPITVAEGVMVTVAENANWTIV